MAARTRLAIALAGIASLGALYVFFSTQADREPAIPLAHAPAADAPMATSELIAVEELTPESESPTEEDAPAAESRATAPRAGPGKIAGKATLADEVAKAPIAVELHFVEPDLEKYTGNDTKLATTTAAADGAFSFDKLPLGQFQLYASTGTHVAQGVAVLTRDEPQSNAILRLFPGGAIAGRVVDPNHDPVADASVFITFSDVAGQQRAAPRLRMLSSRVVTDADGRFTMGFLRLSQNNEPGYRLGVKAEGFATHETDFIQAGTNTADIVLSEGAVVSGSLTKAGTTEPVPNETVQIASTFEFDSLAATSDADGFFFIPHVPAGVHTARLEDSDLLIVPETSFFEVPKDAPAAEVALQVLPGGSISGRVYNADSNSGMPDIVVHAYTDGSDRHKVTTAADGSYAIRGLAPISYQVSIESPIGYTFPKDRGFSFAKLTPESGGEIKGIDFALTRGLSISGLVVDDEDKPIADARVSASAYDGGNESQSRTDDRGAFTVSGLHATSTVELYASKDGFASQPRERGERRTTYDLKQNVTGAKLVLVPASKVTGIVVDTRGAPARAARISMQTATEPPRMVDTAIADASGAITFERVPPGKFLVGLNQPNTGFVQDEATALRITVPRGGAISGLRIVVPANEGQFSIAGRVVDARGNPVARASVSVASLGSINSPRGQNVTANANGVFVVTDLLAGAHDIWAGASGFAGADRQRVAAGATDVVITLKDYARIEGRVVNEQTGQPIPLFTLNRDSDSKDVRDPEGRFVLEEVPEHAAVLHVNAEGYAPASLPLPPIVPGQTIRDIIVRMAPGAELSGIVRDRAGQPIAGAWIGIQSPENRERSLYSLNVTSAPDGTFQMRSLPTGRFELTAYHQTFASSTQPVTITYGARNYAELTLSAGASITGIVTHLGEPAKGAYVSVNVNRRGSSMRTDTQGRYRIDHLNAGQADIHVSHSSESSSLSRTATATIAEGTVTEKNIELSQGTATLEGTIFTTPGNPDRSRTYVEASWGEAGGRAGVQADANGNYIFPGLPEGDVVVHVRQDRRTPKQVTVHVAAGQRTRRDIVLSSGTALRVDLSGTSTTRTWMPLIMLLRGHIVIESLDEKALDSLNSKRVDRRDITGGSYTFTSLEPGPYTVLVWEHSNAAAQLGNRSIGRWTSATIDVTDETEQTLQLSL